jgi:hypothetical protein
MRFLTMVKSDESMPVGPPPPGLMAGIAELGVRATKDGTLLDQGGLLPTATGALVRVSGGKVTVVDGPFAEAKEVIGGYAMWQVRSKEEAVHAARRFMQLHADLWPGYVGVCEVRQVMDQPGGPPQQ